MDAEKTLNLLSAAREFDEQIKTLQQLGEEYIKDVFVYYEGGVMTKEQLNSPFRLGYCDKITRAINNLNNKFDEFIVILYEIIIETPDWWEQNEILDLIEQSTEEIPSLDRNKDIKEIIADLYGDFHPADYLWIIASAVKECSKWHFIKGECGFRLRYFYSKYKEKYKNIILSKINAECRERVEFLKDSLCSKDVYACTEYISTIKSISDIKMAYGLFNGYYNQIEQNVKYIEDFELYKNDNNIFGQYSYIYKFFQLYERLKNKYTTVEKQINRTDTSDELSSLEDKLPQQLKSERALKYLNRAVKLGYLDSNYLWISEGHTRSQQTYLAHLICKALDIPDKWKLFGEFWGYARFAQTWGKINNEGLEVRNEKELDLIVVD